MDVDQLRKGIGSGDVSAEQLMHLLELSQRQLSPALKRIEELERQLGGPTAEARSAVFDGGGGASSSSQRGQEATPTAEQRSSGAAG